MTKEHLVKTNDASASGGRMEELANEQGTGQIDKMRRKAYMKSKGINPNADFQLDLIFPKTVGERGDLRHIPNDYARSSLFTARNKREPRKTLVHEKLFHYNEFVAIQYTGIELRADDDEIVWLQILYYGRNVPLGEPFEFSIRDLVRDLNWTKNGRNYDRARKSISRLKANEVMALNSKAYGTSGAISLIQHYTAVNDSEGKATQYRVDIHPNLAVLFAGNTFTSHTWETYRNLSPIARRLADYAESHKHPFPLGLEKFRQICGSNNLSLTSWRQAVKKACAEVQQATIVAAAFLTSDDQICCVSE